MTEYEKNQRRLRKGRNRHARRMAGFCIDCGRQAESKPGGGFKWRCRVCADRFNQLAAARASRGG